MNSHSTYQTKTGIRFRNLTDLPIEHLLTCFNECFKEYFVPLQLTLPQFLQKIMTENIDLNLSVGAFDDDKLVGFILQGLDTLNEQRIAYNAGTGVLPAYRGTKLTGHMYEYALGLFLLRRVSSSTPINFIEISRGTRRLRS